MSDQTQILKLKVDGNHSVLCPYCSEQMTPGMTTTTMVGSVSKPNHNHNPNCRVRMYRCPKDTAHSLRLSIVNKCSNPTCDWTSGRDCFCHDFKKLDYWPEEAPFVPVEIELIPKAQPVQSGEVKSEDGLKIQNSGMYGQMSDTDATAALISSKHTKDITSK